MCVGGVGIGEGVITVDKLVGPALAVLTLNCACVLLCGWTLVSCECLYSENEGQGWVEVIRRCSVGLHNTQTGAHIEYIQ